MNIYQIKQELTSIFDEIEENGGELTPELEEKLTVTKENFASKIKSYVNMTKVLEIDLEAIKSETKRLKDLYDKKVKTIDKLKSIIIDAVEQFGSKKPTGVKYLDYGTGSVSVRKSKSVEIDKDVVNKIGTAIMFAAIDYRQTNQLEVLDSINPNNIISFVKQEVLDKDGDGIQGYDVTLDDLRHTNVELSITVPVSELIDGDAYPIIREMAKKSVLFNVEGSTSKRTLKKDLEEDGCCAPNIARLVENKKVIIN